MDSLNENFLWLSNNPTFAKELSGTFVTLLEGAPCILELEVNHKRLRGSLTLDGENFELTGFYSRVSRAAYGVLHEPVMNSPVALLKITTTVWGLRLELDMPDFEVTGNIYKPHTFTFRRS